MNKSYSQSDRDLAIKYFFGEISKEEQDNIEDRYFEEDDYSIFLDSIEHDLIDDYVCERFDDRQKNVFEKKYLNCKERQQKVIFAKTLQKKIAEKSSLEIGKSVPKNAWFEFLRFPKLAFAGGLAAMLLAVLLGWIFLRTEKEPEIVKSNSNNLDSNVSIPINSQTTPNVEIGNNNQIEKNSNKPKITPGNKPTNSNLEKEVLKEIEEPKEIEKPKIEDKPKIDNKSNEKEKPQPPQSPSFATIILLPTMRSGDKPSLKINPNTKFVQLKILSENSVDSADYKIEVRDSSGNLVASQSFKNTSKNPSKTFLVKIPTKKLATDSYETVLKVKDKDGTEKTLSFYEFNLVKEK